MVVVNEIFYSIQGETTRAGLPCVFVRLTGCDLRCVYCDSEYAFHDGARMSIEQVEREVASHGCRFVTITGGEPLLQEEVFPLMRRLVDANYDLQVETSGAVDVTPVDPRVRVILDIKTPGSGMRDRMDWDNIGRLKPGDEVKFVLMDREDYVWAVKLLRERALPDGVPILMSPAHGRLDPRHLAEWMKSDLLPARLQLQVHKYIWGAGERGV